MLQLRDVKMPNKNKLRSYAQETQIVKAFASACIKADRMWGSNGNARGYHAEVDIIIPKWWVSNNCNSDITGEIKLQAKKKKKLPDWLGFTEHVDGVITSCDYGKKYIMFELNDFINRFMK